MPSERFMPTLGKRIRIGIRKAVVETIELAVKRLREFLATDLTAAIEIKMAEHASIVFEVGR